MKNELLISNVMMNGIAKLNTKLHGVHISNGFGTWEQYLIDPVYYELAEYSCIIIILDGDKLRDNYEDVGDLIHILSLIGDFSKQHNEILIYISNIRCRNKTVIDAAEMHCIEEFETKINRSIYCLCEKYTNIVCINIKKFIEAIGEEKAYSKQMEYMSSCPYSVKVQKCMADEIARMDYFNQNTRKKCLVVDLDNTLWGGVIGEEGIDGITLSNHKEGKQYYDFQNIILKIKSTGIILAISSKNNMEDVEGVFKKEFMLLKKDDFVIAKINWNPKSKSINEIATELNIGLDSIVFIDDNPVEREEVKKHLPDVVVPDFPENAADLEEFGLFLYEQYFRTDKVLKEDAEKTKMYIANKERNKLKNTTLNLDEFVKSLEITLIISGADPSHLSRIAQMTQKTNQFNLTTKRYTESDISEMLKDKNKKIYIGSVKDKFGDNGITLLCILLLDEEEAYIDEFLMSCRVMERKIEFDFLRYIENKLKKEGYAALHGEFLRTNKNKPASNFYKEYGFASTDSPMHYIKNIQQQEYSGLIKIEE